MRERRQFVRSSTDDINSNPFYYHCDANSRHENTKFWSQRMSRSHPFCIAVWFSIRPIGYNNNPLTARISPRGEPRVLQITSGTASRLGPLPTVGVSLEAMRQHDCSTPCKLSIIVVVATHHTPTITLHGRLHECHCARASTLAITRVSGCPMPMLE